ncbi:MAG TPA: cation:proton antiporter, partial [Candidatus Nanoarchaeia archaeon]|nr:cation:proton antiporter [Candidatus Nanoarchaeia archaeon]
VKILSDKKELDTLHGRIALGILIVEDFIASIVLMLLPVIQSGDINAIWMSIGKIVVLAIGVFVLYNLIIKRSMDHLARNQEVLFLTGISYAFILAATFHHFGLSLEIGALIAGMSLSSSKYTMEISGRIKPLRDFFVIILFVYFGAQLVGPLNADIIKTSLIFSGIILFIKPFIVMGFMRALGYKKRTNFMTGVSMAQLSEFSLIVVLIGYHSGALTADIMNIAVLVSLTTIAVSSYSLYYSNGIFNKISHLLNIFDSNRTEASLNNKDRDTYDIILFGYHRMGYKILSELKKMNSKILVIDYNPKVILSLAKEGIDCMYGDAADKEFLSEIKLGKTKLVISTIPDEESNIAIKKDLEETQSKAAFIGTAEQPRTALDLYNQGADYVIIPHHLGGEFMANMIKDNGLTQEGYKALGREHKKKLLKAKKGSSF